MYVTYTDTDDISKTDDLPYSSGEDTKTNAQ